MGALDDERLDRAFRAMEPDRVPPLPGSPLERVRRVAQRLVHVSQGPTAGAAARFAAPMVGLLTVVALGLGSWWMATGRAEPLELPMASTGGQPGAVESGGQDGGAAGGTATAETASVLVHVAGAVRRSGVVRLSEGERIDDAVAAAGGPTRRADLDRLNLAAPVADGSRVWVPRRGEEVEPPPLEPGVPETESSSVEDGGPDTVVDLNTADEAELDTLPGVGPVTAAAIITYREDQGPFDTVDELLDVPGIGDTRFAQLQPLVGA